MQKQIVSILTVLVTFIPWYLHRGHIIRLAPDDIRVWCQAGIFINLMFLIYEVKKDSSDFEKIAPLAACLALVGIPGAMLTNNEKSLLWCLFSILPAIVWTVYSLVKSIERRAS